MPLQVLIVSWTANIVLVNTKSEISHKTLKVANKRKLFCIKSFFALHITILNTIMTIANIITILQFMLSDVKENLTKNKCFINSKNKDEVINYKSLDVRP